MDIVHVVLTKFQRQACRTLGFTTSKLKLPSRVIESPHLIGHLSRLLRLRQELQSILPDNPYILYTDDCAVFLQPSAHATLNELLDVCKSEYKDKVLFAAQDGSLNANIFFGHVKDVLSLLQDIKDEETMHSYFARQWTFHQNRIALDTEHKFFSVLDSATENHRLTLKTTCESKQVLSQPIETSDKKTPLAFIANLPATQLKWFPLLLDYYGLKSAKADLVGEFKYGSLYVMVRSLVSVLLVIALAAFVTLLA